MGGNVSKVARDNLVQKLGKSVISNQNNLNYQYLGEKLENQTKNNWCILWWILVLAYTVYLIKNTN